MSINTTKELKKEENNFQLNMEILSSLKPLKGKVVNLQPDYLFQKKEKEDINKINIFTEDFLSTSNSIPMLSKLKSQNKSYTTNSAFKPISLNEVQNRTQTINYNNPEYRTFMSYPNIFFEKQNVYNKNLIFNSLINQNIFLNSFPTIKKPSHNEICPIYRIDNEEKKYFKKINIKKDNILLNKKRKNENEKIYKNDEVIIKNNYLKNSNKNNKNVFFITKKEEIKNIPKTPKISSKKNMFNVYKRSKYTFIKRKKRIKKELKIKNYEIICGHEGCKGVFKTKKQLIFHHYKMSIECHNDTISLLKLISNVKKILLKIDKNDENKGNNILEKYSSLYKETMKTISLDEHIEAIVGFDFED